MSTLGAVLNRSMQHSIFLFNIIVLHRPVENAVGNGHFRYLVYVFFWFVSFNTIYHKREFCGGIDLSVHSQTKLNAGARQLNERPRKTLEFETPAQRFNACVALTS